MLKNTVLSKILCLFLFGIFTVLILNSCHKNVQLSNPDDFRNYISAYTPDIIAKNDVITVQLTDEFASKLKEQKTDVISLSPSISGTTTWKNEKTIEFKPDNPFEPGTKYFVVFSLKDLNEEIPRENRKFVFQTTVKKQFVSVVLDRINTTDLQGFTKQDIYYKVSLNDVETEENLLKCFSSNKTANLDIEKNSDTDFTLIARNVERTNEFREFILTFYGGKINSKSQTEIAIPILPRDEFNVVNVSVFQQPEQYINVVFSDPIEPQQYLDGIVSLGEEDIKFLIVDNVLKIIPTQKLTKDYSLLISKGIKNIKGATLSDPNYYETLSFAFRNPQLRKLSTEGILPSADNKQIIAFDAVNIKAVDVRITQIYENNILQFLQQNSSLSGDYQLNRVGKPVAQKTIDLRETNVENFDQWNTFFIDISTLVKVQPGAIYRIEINFRQENAIYLSQDAKNNEKISILAEDDEFWNNFTDYTYYPENYNYYDDDNYDDDYDYYSENNPSKYNFYGYKTAIKYNILASNVGLIVKMGNNRVVNAYVTDILTANPASNAKVEVFDYQQQLIGSATSDSEGKVTINFGKKDVPYFVVASVKGQKAYLTLESYKALYTSKFDVEGEAVQNGTKAFIYTERSVWRPGDSIFVGLIINETLDKTPIGLPISFEVKNPKNQLVFSEIQKKNEEGFLVFKFKTDQNAPTGYYNATVKFGGLTFSKTLMVETIKPNRLNINLDFNQKYLSGDGSVKANLDVTYLFGGAAANLNFTTNITFEQKYTPFPKFKDYSFENQAVKTNFETTQLLSGKTDANGHFSSPVRFAKIKNAPSILNANLTTKVFEQGGNVSISEQKITYYPFDNYVGMEVIGESYQINKLVKINFVSVDRDEKLDQTARNIEISVYRLENYWWYDYSENNVDYITSNYNNSVLRQNIQLTSGKAKFEINFSDGGYYFIAAKNLANGQTSAKQIYVSSYNYDDKNYTADSPEILEFKAEKDVYLVGEKVKVSVPLGQGNALVSIENSSKVLKSFWQKTKGNKLDFEFEATAEMAPNIYINVSFVQAHGNNSNDVPLRIYGIIPISVVNSATNLLPIIEMPEELPAESKIKITVSEFNGKSMTYTVAMVDEGLLALTNFKTPNPWLQFYAKEALGVNTWDIFDNVVKAFAIDANRLLSIGGGMDAANSEDLKQANRFKPMVRFIGPFTLKKGEKKTHEIQLPQYVGAVRTMVIAANNDNAAYGSAEKRTPVTKPLMILGTAPRKISTDEIFKLPVTVFAMKDDVKNVTVTVKTNDKLKIVGNATQSVNFVKTGEKNVNFNIKALAKEGVGTIEITSKSGNYVSNYSIEMDVTYINSISTDVIDVVMGENGYETTFTPNGIEGTNEAFLELYTIPPLNLEARLQYLLSYPHGCIEQITSGAFPQIYLANFTDLDANQKDKAKKNIEETIKKLQKYQTSDGGFAYWMGGNYANEWGTSYAGHFMLEAEKAGYNIPTSLKNNWLKYQKNKTTKWTDSGKESQMNQAYRLYTLALSGSPDRSAMNRMKELKLADVATWNLAASYAVSGKTQIAAEIINKLPKTVNNYVELSGTFGSGLRDKAIILDVLTTLKQKENAFLVLKDIAEVIGSKAYCNTQATAYSLMAISKYVKAFGNSNQINCSYTLNGQKFTAKTEKSVYQIKINILDGDNNLSLKPANSEMLYARIILKGIPQAGHETDANSNINMTVSYTNLEGSTIDVTNLRQGTDFVATITLKHFNPSIYYLNNVALTQIFPSGWEITNSRMNNVNLGNASSFDYQDIRDDRVLTYFDMSRNSTYTFNVLLTASYAGEYYLPAVSCETMYDDANIARIKGKFVRVVE